MRPQDVISIVAAAAVVQGCGLFLSEPAAPIQPGVLPRDDDPPPGWSIEGEVRDYVTLAPAADAEVVVTTARQGYEARTRTDPRGRFSLTFSRLERVRSTGDRVLESVLFGSGDEPDPRVDEFTVRARAGDRCALPERVEVRARQRPLQLYLVPCPPAATR